MLWHPAIILMEIHHNRTSSVCESQRQYYQHFIAIVWVTLLYRQKHRHWAHACSISVVQKEIHICLCSFCDILQSTSHHKVLVVVQNYLDEFYWLTILCRYVWSPINFPSSSLQLYSALKRHSSCCSISAMSPASQNV